MTYTAQWQDYRKKRNLVWLLFLAYVPGVAIIGFTLQHLLKSELPFYFAAGVWLTAYIAASWRLDTFKCPACGRKFHSTRWGHNPFVHKCLYCGLPKWAVEGHENPQT